MNFLNNPLLRTIRHIYLIAMSHRNHLRGHAVFQRVKIRPVWILVGIIVIWLGYMSFRAPILIWYAGAAILLYLWLWLIQRAAAKALYWWRTKPPKLERPEFTKFDQNLATEAPVRLPTRGGRYKARIIVRPKPRT